LGSPLTHAPYLMCRGKTEDELKEDFARRVREREFPACPPPLLDGDQRMTFYNPKAQKHQFHSGGVFALTRWTNLYFPASELLWGDPIGGELSSLFGENIADVSVYANDGRRNSLFAHVLYWKRGSDADPPHIAALSDAIDLADEGTANDPSKIGVRPPPTASPPSAPTA